MTKADEKRETIETYNRTALLQAQKFDKIGARKKEIEKTFSYIKKENPKTIELGCGNGRDAKEIIKHTNNYLGVDLSEGMLQIARKNVPQANFQLADIETYKFPKKVDAIFSFASLLHSDKTSVKRILKRAYQALSAGGVFFMSLKYGRYHKEKLDREGFGPRTYYFYTPKEIKNLSPSGFKKIFQSVHNFRGEKWLQFIFQKPLTPSL